MSQLPAGLRARVLASRASVPATRPGAWGLRVAAAVVFTAGWAASLAAFWTRPDWADLPVWYRVASVALVGATALTLLLLTLTRGRYMVGASAGVVRLLTALLPALTLAWVVFFAYPTSPPGTFAQELSSSWHCHMHALLMALPILGVVAWLRRRLTLSAPGLVGACLGASAAAWSHVILFSTCPMGGPVHASVGHVLPVLPLMLLGALVGQRVFR